MTLGTFDFSLNGFWKDLATLAAQEKISSLPSFSVPLTAQTSFAFGGTSKLTFPTGNGSTVSGVLTVAPISGAASLGTPSRCVASVAVVASLVMGCSRTSTEVEDLRKTVKDSVKPYLIPDADVQIKISQSILTKVVTKVASLPPASRRITFTSNSRSGYVWSQGGGFAGCGGFAEVDKLNLAVDINELHGNGSPMADSLSVSALPHKRMATFTAISTVQRGRVPCSS